ncbi:vomeronasal type-2 receptor 116-like [Dipodomys spectabilis]|uniref:vomeronasal type-2 receptor 116-like n=1 Tax=Dipodomys spectabilis TaxID=105255 RepID=UPI001C54875D|nr:vomeronasal type-2 receptor 116-like [Dipodomys spectabilis]
MVVHLSGHPGNKKPQKLKIHLDTCQSCRLSVQIELQLYAKAAAMFPVALILLLLQLPLGASYSEDARTICREKYVVHSRGDVVIAGFFPLYSWEFVPNVNYLALQQQGFQTNLKKYQLLLTLVLAVEEINKNRHLLPNMTLGFEIYSEHYKDTDMLEDPLIWLSGKNKNNPNYTCRTDSKALAALTGTSSTSVAIGTLLDLYKLPQFTFGSFDPLLSDHGKFSTVYQMAAKDSGLALAMVSLMLYFRWTWVGLFISEDDYSVWFLSELREEMGKNGICLAFENMITYIAISDISNDLSMHLQLMESSTNVIIIYGDSKFLLSFIIKFGHFLITGKVWVMNSPYEDMTIGKRYFLINSFHAPLIFSHHLRNTSGFTNFILTDTLSKNSGVDSLSRAWIQSFYCLLIKSDCRDLGHCSYNATLDWLLRHIFDMTMSDESYNIYNTVYALAHALHQRFLHHTEEPPVDNMQPRAFLSSQLHPFLRKIQFTNPVGDQVVLNEERKLEAEYDILSVWNFPEGLGQRVKVGEFSPSRPHGQQLTLFENLIEWPIGITKTPQSVCTESCGPGFRKTSLEGNATCCFDCTPCPENEISNVTDMEQCMRCPDLQFANTERKRCLMKTESFLAYEDPLGMTLICTALCCSALTAFVLGVFIKYQDTPVIKANNRNLSNILLISLICCFLCSLLFLGHPHTATCILQHTTFAVVFTVAVSTVLAKTITVVLAFTLTAPGRSMRQWLVSRAPNLIIPICTLIQVTLCGLWLHISPPFVDRDAHSEHGHVIILCNKGSLTAFYCVLGYLGTLALASFTVAFLARNLPDTFNEAKFLTFSMLVFCSVWLTFLPVYHSTKGKVMVAVEVFSILSSSGGLLGCIFVPKCYIILIRPERNSLNRFKRIHSFLDNVISFLVLSQFCPPFPTTKFCQEIEIQLVTLIEIVEHRQLVGWMVT